MCEMCRSIPHDYRCPNAAAPKAIYECDICGEGIYAGADYVEHEGEHYHVDCLTVKDALEMGDIPIQVVDDYEPYDPDYDYELARDMGEL